MTLIFDNFPGTCTTFDIPENCEKYDILLQVACVSGAILVIFSDFGLGQPKRHFFDTFFSILTMKGPKMWQKSLITWKYDGKTPLEKNWGSFVHRGLRYDFLRRKNMDRSIDLAVQHTEIDEDLHIRFTVFGWAYHFLWNGRHQNVVSDLSCIFSGSFCFEYWIITEQDVVYCRELERGMSLVALLVFSCAPWEVAQLCNWCRRPILLWCMRSAR